jgi:hypothetical protein
MATIVFIIKKYYSIFTSIFIKIPLLQKCYIEQSVLPIQSDYKYF